MKRQHQIVTMPCFGTNPFEIYNKNKVQGQGQPCFLPLLGSFLMWVSEFCPEGWWGKLWNYWNVNETEGGIWLNRDRKHIIRHMCFYIISGMWHQFESTQIQPLYSLCWRSSLAFGGTHMSWDSWADLFNIATGQKIFLPPVEICVSVKIIFYL